jgi:SecY interacting protein Syd
MQEQWQQFVQTYVQNTIPTIEFDDEWLSPCLQIDAQFNPALVDNGTMLPWIMEPRTGASLANLNEALDFLLPPALSDFYCSCFAYHLEVHFAGKNLTLLQVWNEDDFRQLQENIIGHVLMKRRLRQRDTIFIGFTEDDEEIISVDIGTQAVVVERVGQEWEVELAPDLPTFIAQLIAAK